MYKMRTRVKGEQISSEAAGLITVIKSATLRLPSLVVILAKTSRKQ